MLDQEQIGNFCINPDSCSIDFDAQAGLSLFYATFDGKLAIAFCLNFR